MKKNQKASLIISIILFILFVILVLIVYFSNTTFATDASIFTAESDITLDTLEFIPIENSTKPKINTNFVQSRMKLNASLIMECIESDTDSMIDDVQPEVMLSPNDIQLTNEEAYRLAALVQAEADNLYECKTAIASLFLNRMYFYEETFWETLNREGQFLTDWGTLPYAEPEEDTIQAVYDVLENGTTIPAYVMFYKIEGYHDWGDQMGWNIIGTTYFSYSQWQREEIEYRLGE